MTQFSADRLHDLAHGRRQDEQHQNPREHTRGDTYTESNQVAVAGVVGSLHVLARLRATCGEATTRATIRLVHAANAGYNALEIGLRQV